MLTGAVMPPTWQFAELGTLRASGDNSLAGGPFGSDLTTVDYQTEPGVPVIRGTNLGGEGGEFVDDGFVFVSNRKAESLRRNMAFPGDIVFTQRGTLGQVAIIPTKPRFPCYVISQSQMKLTPDIRRIDVRFLFHYFRSPLLLAQISARTLATGVPHINLGILKALPVPIPPLPEQRRIAAILDQSIALRAKRRAALAKLDQLTHSIFLEHFGDPADNSKGWPDSTLLGDVADIASGITKGRVLKGQPTRTVPYLAVSNVQDRSLDLSVVKQIEATEDEIRRYQLRQNDLLLTEGGDPDKLGRGTLWNSEIPACIHQNHIFRVRVTSALVKPLFLNWLVGSQRGKRYFLRSAKQTTGIASINMTQLRGFPLLLPPVDLQQSFARSVAAVDSLKAVHLASLAKLDALFASLQHRAFSGEM